MCVDSATRSEDTESHPPRLNVPPERAGRRPSSSSAPPPASATAPHAGRPRELYRDCGYSKDKFSATGKDKAPPLCTDAVDIELALAAILFDATADRDQLPQF